MFLVFVVIFPKIYFGLPLTQNERNKHAKILDNC